VDKNLLELWGHTLLEMAKMVEGTQSFYNLFQNGFAKKEQGLGATQKQFMELLSKSFGAEGIEAFNTAMKEFYENVGVVPRTEYDALRAKYTDLKKKVQELEEKIKKLKRQMKTGVSSADDLMEQWTETAQKYTEINHQFFEEFSRFFK
jgi:peptidoglycan hydrolase CwlO-like protein